MGKFVDLTGKKFGKLTVIKRAENNKNGKVQWLCKCDCGNKKIIIGNSLKSGLIKSCGCLRSETSRKKRGINIYNCGTQKTILKLEGIKETKWGFQVQMRVNGKLKCFGTYKTYEKAKEIRIKAEQEYRPYVKEINKYGK